MSPGVEGAIVVTATNVGRGDRWRRGHGRRCAARERIGARGARRRCLPVAWGFEDGRSERLSCSAVTVSCTASAIDTGDQLVMTVSVKPPASGAGNANEASVSGGGASPASVRTAFAAGDSAAVPFGPVPGSVVSALSTSQAGAHPDYTTQYTLEASAYTTTAGDAKDVRFDLPQGLVGSTVGMARCTMGRVQLTLEDPQDCPADTIVGMATVTLFSSGIEAGRTYSFVLPVYNIAPSPGEPAAFAFEVKSTPVRLDTSVLTDGEDNVRVTAPSLAETLHNFTTSVTVWGVPSEHAGQLGRNERYRKPRRISRSQRRHVRRCRT